MDDKHAIQYEMVQNKIISFRNQEVIFDHDVAELYGVETREVNQAVRNNPEKFPYGYVLEPDKKELADLQSKFLIANNPKSRVAPKAFTEKGLYMLATILKSKQAIQTTIAIIEAFAKLRELSRTIAKMTQNPNEFEQKELMKKSGGIVEDLFGDSLQTTDTETEIELNFAVLKLKHKIKRKK